MYKSSILVAGLLALFSTNIFAQTQVAQNTPNSAFRSQSLELSLDFLLEKDDDNTVGVRPRVVSDKPAKQPESGPERASGVKAIVITNLLSVEKHVFDKINEIRVGSGLNPLKWNADLERVARLHSENMAENGFFGHRDLDGKVVSDRADREGLGKWNAIGENIAFNRGFDQPTDRAVSDWMDSASHKRNLLDERWKEAAIGVAQAADGSYYFTQVFLARK